MKNSKNIKLKFITLALSLVLAFGVVAFTACFEEPYSTITFDSMGGSSVASITVPDRSFVGNYIQDIAPTKRGHIFGGWYIDRELTTDTHSVRTGEDITLYARWTAITNIEVSFEAGTNVTNPTSIRVTFGQNYGALPTATRFGYEFAGWWTSPYGEGSTITAETIVDNYTAHTLYARWTQIFVITFNVGLGAENAPNNIGAIFGRELSTPNRTPTKHGHNFVGFFDAEIGGIQYFDYDLTPLRNWARESSATLYARWQHAIFVGLGTQDSPFLINNASELNALREFEGSHPFGRPRRAFYYRLMADIDLDGGEWQPIANLVIGTVFDGNGHVVHNFTMSGGGFFRVNTGTITNFGIRDFDMTITTAGTFAGGLVMENNYRISNSFAKGSITVNHRSITVGGLVGVASSSGTRYSIIENSFARVGINVVGTLEFNVIFPLPANAGGLVGSMQAGIVENSFASGNVSVKSGSTGAFHAGGLIGSVSTVGIQSIRDSIAFGNVSAYAYRGTSNIRLGGLIGGMGNIGVVQKENNFRFSLQQFLREGLHVDSAYRYIATNSYGTVADFTILNSQNFWQNTVEWCDTIWDFSAVNVLNSTFPALRVFG